VVTGFTNLRSWVTTAQLVAAVGKGTLLIPCEVTVVSPGALANAVPHMSCVPVNSVAGRLDAKPTTLALLPPGLVEVKTKVLPVDPTGPYSLGGADLFGDASARAKAYPVQGQARTLPAWTASDQSTIWTLVSLGDSCPDRGVALQAITNRRGWGWVMGGGTARYLRVYPNPVPINQVGGGYNIVSAVASGHAGALARLTSGADITIDDFECPVVDNWRVNDGVVFSIDPAVLPKLRDVLGVDVAYMAANHMTDQGIAGLRSTLQKFDAAKIKRVGAGMTLNEALRPAIVEVAGVKLAFVAFNDVPGVLRATASSPGVAWITPANVTAAVQRAKTAGADLVFCDPQWWGGAEYHAQLIGDQVAQQEMFYDAGCDHVLGAGTHWTGPLQLRRAGGAVHLTMASQGNFLFGQSWSQQTQEGVIVELAFRGTDLVQVRFHPYIMLLQAQANLIDPATDGHYVLNRLFRNSKTSY
jgi:poly-gamma-glutamate capsule biosynthesis protein CapA/YwtB (metallophosphatase superfamily)